VAVVVLAVAAAALVGGPVTAQPVAAGSPATALSGTAADGGGVGARIPFKPLRGLKPGMWHRNAVGVHTVQVYPLYFAAKPSVGAVKRSAAQVRSYYRRQLPGVTFTFKVHAARKASKSRACTPDFGYLRKVAHKRSLAARKHIVGIGFGCTGSDGAWGLGSLSDGRGSAWVMTGRRTGEDIVAAVMAHELGHNLGLYHSNSIACRGAGGAVTALSGRCKQYEYSDPWDAQGSGCDISICQLAGVGQVLLGAKASSRVVAAKRTTDVRLVAPGRAGVRTALVRTGFGDVMFDMHPASDALIGFGNEGSVQARLATTEGQGLLRLPDYRGRFSSDPTFDDVAGGLPLGGHWDIPGTGGLRAVVTGLTSATVSVRFAPAGTDRKAPSRPTITSSPRYVDGSDLRVAWTAASDASGILAYLVVVDGVVVDRVAGTVHAVTVPEGRSVKVLAVDAFGNTAESAPMSPVAVPFSADYRVDGTLLTLDADADEWNPTYSRKVSSSAVIDVAADPLWAASVRSLSATGFHGDDLDDSEVVSPNRRTLTLPPAWRSAIANATQDDPVEIDVTVELKVGDDSDWRSATLLLWGS
jgi:hypothetical protein